MGKLPDNYKGPHERLKDAKVDHGAELIVKSNATVYSFGENAGVLIKVQIEVGGKVLAEAHAFSDVTEEKGVEKAETAAMGRALVLMGYEALDGDFESDEPSEGKPAKKSGLGSGLGKKSKSKDEDESEDAEAEEEEKPVKKGLDFKKLASKKKEEVEEEAEEESEDEEESDDTEEEEAEEKPAKKAPSSKLSGVMAKYGMK